MRYDIYVLVKVGTDKQFEEVEEILGSVVATNPEEAKIVALENIKEARGKKLLVKEAPLKGVFK